MDLGNGTSAARPRLTHMYSMYMLPRYEENGP